MWFDRYAQPTFSLSQTVSRGGLQSFSTPPQWKDRYHHQSVSSLFVASFDMVASRFLLSCSRWTVRAMLCWLGNQAESKIRQIPQNFLVCKARRISTASDTGSPPFLNIISLRECVRE
jgi:hypothetical protein